MVDRDAARIALLVAAGAVIVIVGGQIMRWVTRMVSWAIMMGIVLALAYITYQLYVGWNEDQESPSSLGSLTDVAESTDSVEELRKDYLDNELSEAEFEAELDRLLDDDRKDRERALERE